MLASRSLSLLRVGPPFVGAAVARRITTHALSGGSGGQPSGPPGSAWEANPDFDKLSTFDWGDIPTDRIAQRPLEHRSSSRLLALNGSTGDLQHLRFSDLVHQSLLRPGDLLVLNNTQVIPARLLGRKATGGGTEILLDRLLPEDPSEFLGMVRSPPRELPSPVYVWGQAADGASGVEEPFRAGAVVHTLMIVGVADQGGPSGASAADKQGAGAKLFRIRYVGARRRLADAPNPGDSANAWKNLFLDSEWARVTDLPQPVSALDLLHTAGRLPLPTYIHRAADERDRVQYQTVFAETPGAMAAPTAGLHFDAELLEELERRGVQRAQVTLHVGLGTFLPVKSEKIAEHQMHSEFAQIDQLACDRINETKARGGRIIAVGTTSVRTLESACLEQGLTPLDAPGYNPAATAAGRFRLQAWSGHTKLFIRPERFDWRCVDGLITNFHVNRSTLLMLVSAFGGYHNVRRAYAAALANPDYRFFSFGDAMFITRQPQPRLFTVGVRAGAASRL